MKNFIRILRSVLLCTLIVVCICGCGKNTASYLSSEDKGSSEQIPDTMVEMEKDTEQSSQSQKDTEVTQIYVYICGAVKHPGVYTLPEGSRVCSLFELAGGLLEDAATDYWNQARILMDGEMLYVPTKEEAQERQGSEVAPYSQGADSASGNNLNGKIDLNTATVEQLMEIPGIGESKARSIISYREANGRFSSIEDVMQIEGIKEGVFSKMKEYIVVN